MYENAQNVLTQTPHPILPPGLVTGSHILRLPWSGPLTPPPLQILDLPLQKTTIWFSRVNTMHNCIWVQTGQIQQVILTATTKHLQAA